MKRRWSLGGYLLKYNPKSNEKSLVASGEAGMSANGMVSVNNLWYDKDSSFSFELYEKPTFFFPKDITYDYGLYNAIAQDRTTYELYMLQAGTERVDIFVDRQYDRDMTISSGIVGSFPTCMAHLDDKVAFIYDNGSLVIVGENGQLISKYIYSDEDIISMASLTYDYDSQYIYGVNKYGKIFRFTTSGTSQLIYTSTDYNENKSGGKEIYKALHYADGFISVMADKTIKYYDSSFRKVHSIELHEVNLNIVDISYGGFTNEFNALTDDGVRRFEPNTCVLDISKIKKELANGIVAVKDENNIQRFLSVTEMSIGRKRNKGESRYEISISGKLL